MVRQICTTKTWRASKMDGNDKENAKQPATTERLSNTTKQRNRSLFLSKLKNIPTVHLRNNANMSSLTIPTLIEKNTNDSYYKSKNIYNVNPFIINQHVFKVASKVFPIPEQDTKEVDDWIVAGKPGKNQNETDISKIEPSFSTTYRYPTTILIQSKDGSSNKYAAHTILQGLLTMLKTIDSGIGLGPIDISNDDDFILDDPSCIPNVKTTTDKFLEGQTQSNKGSVQGRVYIHTNMPFQKIRNDSSFSKWLINEKTSIKINTLNDATLSPAGFLIHCIPRLDYVHTIEQKYTKLMPSGTPPFIVNPDNIYTINAKAKVLMIYTAHHDVEQVQKAFLNQPNTNFHEWNDYLGLVPRQRLTIINKQNKYMATYRSLFIDGFTNNETTIWKTNENEIKENDDMAWMMAGDNILLHEHQNRKQLDLTTTTVSEYIQKHYDAGDGTRLFETVYQPANGQIEVIIKHNHLGEALRLAQVLHAELSRIMNLDNFEAAIAAPTDAVNQANSATWWTPNRLAGIIQETEPVFSQEKRRRTKRGPNSQTTTNTTYADITTATRNNPINNLPKKQSLFHPTMHSFNNNNNKTTTTPSTVNQHNQTSLYQNEEFIKELNIMKANNEQYAKDKLELHQKIDNVQASTKELIIQTSKEAVESAAQQLNQSNLNSIKQLQEEQKLSEHRIQMQLNEVKDQHIAVSQNLQNITNQQVVADNKQDNYANEMRQSMMQMFAQMNVLQKSVVNSPRLKTRRRMKDITNEQVAAMYSSDDEHTENDEEEDTDGNMSIESNKIPSNNKENKLESCGSHNKTVARSN